MTMGAGGWTWGFTLCSLPRPGCHEDGGQVMWGRGEGGRGVGDVQLCSLLWPGCFDHRGWGMEGGGDLGLHLFVASHCQLVVQVVQQPLAIGDAKGQVDVLVRVGEVLVPGWVQAFLLHHVNLFIHEIHHL